MKILFLDVDGVLNTRPGSLDGDKLDMLRVIQKATGCTICLSTSWRTVPHMLARLQKAFISHGVKWHGAMTPELEGSSVPWGWSTAAPRHEEISKWLIQSGKPERKVASYAIVDDDWYADDGSGRFVRCDPSIGLTETLAREIVGILNTTHDAGPKS